MDSLQADIEQLRTLKARYCRYLDTHQWEAFRQLLTEDVVLKFYDTEGQLQRQVDGRQAVMNEVPAYLNPSRSVHQVKHHEIELLTPTSATGIWAMEDILTFTNPTHSPVAQVHGFGYYHERYEKQEGHWRITGFELTRLKLDTTPWPVDAAKDGQVA
jgi:hypothetical protein